MNLTNHKNSAGITNIGKHRKKNEDCFTIDRIQHKTFAIVCDGMGGNDHGEIASNIATYHATKYLKTHLVNVTNPLTITKIMEDAILFVNNAVINAHKHYKTVHMGTTFVGVIRYHDLVIVGWCGDSRLYIYNQRLEEPNFLLCQVTKDHGYNNMLSYFVGHPDLCKPSVRIITQELGDLFLLCSDGLTNMLNKEEIAEIIGKNKNNKNLYNICYQLVDAANNAGGQDNITVVLIR